MGWKLTLLRAHPLALLLLTWLAFNVLQAALLPLDPDEAYYWMYAQQLGWGYFDHPPAVALLAKLGIGWLPGPLGVRLGNALLHAGTLFFFWKLVGAPKEPQRFRTWAALALGLPFLHVYGLVATPDGPLLFFSVLYLYLLQRFLERPGWGLALVWGAVMAALLYSKYHGILVILFTVAVHGKLWKDPRFWLAGIWGALLFLPHLWWQYAHDFPSFRYHLKGRDDPYRFEFTYMYVVNQLLVFSPLLFPLFVRALFSSRSCRTCLGLVAGFWIFFLWTTTKGHVEPQWTAVLSFPLVWAAMQYSESRPDFERRLRRMGFWSFGILLFARLVLFLPFPEGVKTPFQEKRWPAELAAIAQGAPVVFQNSYRDVSEYRFYTGWPGYTFTNVFYRPNQFDIWDWEQALQDQRVFFVLQMGQNPCTGCDTLRLHRLMRQGIWADSLQVAQKVRLNAPGFPKKLQAGQLLNFDFSLENPYPHDIHPGRGNLPLRFYAVFLRAGQVEYYSDMQVAPALERWPAGVQQRLRAQIRVPDLTKGKYTVVLGIGNGEIPPAWNSPMLEVTL